MHVNAFFELSSNRRDVWFGTDMSGMGHVRAMWNLALLKHCVAPAWAELLAQATGRTPSISADAPGASDTEALAAYSRLWPVALNKTAQPWRCAAEEVYKCLCSDNKPVIWTSASGGYWLPVSECLFPDKATSSSPALQSALVKLGLPLCTMPAAITEILMQHQGVSLDTASGGAAASQQVASPALARRYLAQQPGIGAALARQTELPALLEYCISDLDPKDPSSVSQLAGLELLSIRDGTVACIRTLGHGGAKTASTAQKTQSQQPIRYYIPTDVETQLFGRRASRLVETSSLPAALVQRLVEMAKLQVV